MNSIEKALNDLQNAVKEELGVQAQVLSAVDAFRVLLGEQLDRIEKMSTEKVDFTSKAVVTIGLIDGDGIGPIIMAQAIRNQFQVVLLPNLYGDIITDEAAQIQGGVGTAGSANIGDRFAMFEAIHGSAPRLLELGLGDYANPQSILKAEAMLLRHICRPQAAQKLENALETCPVTVTGDRSGATCKDYTDALLNLL